MTCSWLKETGSRCRFLYSELERDRRHPTFAIDGEDNIRRPLST